MIAGAVIAAVLVVWIALGVRRQNQLDRRWRLERERIARSDERRVRASIRLRHDVNAVPRDGDRV